MSDVKKKVLSFRARPHSPIPEDQAPEIFLHEMVKCP